MQHTLNDQTHLRERELKSKAMPLKTERQVQLLLGNVE